MLSVNNITGGYGHEPVVKDVSFHVNKGEVIGILGPNGSGKSTLLKLISGILPKQAGTVTIDGTDSSAFSAKQFARKVAVLPQLHAHAFSHTVKETVSLGRYPHQSGLFSTWSDTDERAVTEALAYTGVTRYKDTQIELLSGGEQQRVFVAQALAQEAQILLLDEPTNHLDIAHQQQLLDTIRNHAVDKGVTVVSVFHDINLSSLYCDRLILMEAGQIAVSGQPADVVKEATIGPVYEARVKTQPHPELAKPQMTLLPDLHGQTDPPAVSEKNFTITKETVTFSSSRPLKTVSSAVTNAGMGWYSTFINRHVDKNYDSDDVAAENAAFIEKSGHALSDTVGMMTAVAAKNVEIDTFEAEFGTILIAVTAGTGNAVDVARCLDRENKKTVGTINTWVIINGKLSDEAFIQAMITATEAKTRALQTEEIKDPLTGTQATGTSTDSLLVAATQSGTELPYAGPVTDLGKTIGHGVYTCTVRAIRAYKQATGWTG